MAKKGRATPAQIEARAHAVAVMAIGAAAPCAAAFACIVERDALAAVRVARLLDGSLYVVQSDLGLEATFGVRDIRLGALTFETPSVVCDPWSHDQRRTVPFLREHSMPHGISRALVAFFGDGCSIHGAVGLERRAADPGFSRTEVVAFSAIAPLVSTLADALRACHQLDVTGLCESGPDCGQSSRLRFNLLSLSAREAEVARLMAGGYTYVGISAHCGLSPHTVRTYIRRVYEKLGVTNRADLVRAFLEASRSDGEGLAGTRNDP